VDIPASKLKAEIARILLENNYIKDVKDVVSDEGRPMLRIYLKYAQGEQPVIREIRRISTPGLRRYVGATEIPRVRNGLGMAILSTSKGLMSDRQARQSRTGGELLALVW
jgi:small subunit ribosomal protein S8